MSQVANSVEKRSWFDSKTIFPAIGIGINTVCEALKVSSEWTAGLNAPLRVVSMIVHRKTDFKIAFEAVALAASFFPYGRYVAIALDIGSLAASCYFAHSATPTPSQPSTTFRASTSSWLSNQAITEELEKVFGLHQKIQEVKSRRSLELSKCNAIYAVIGVFKTIGKVDFAYTIALKEDVLKKIYAKTVPGVCLVIGTYFAIKRFSRGQFWRGFGEIASGLSCCVPGYGMIVSFGLDAIMVVIDYRKMHRFAYLSIRVFPFDLSDACEILGIGPNPTKEDVDGAFDALNQLLRLKNVPDSMGIEGSDKILELRKAKDVQDDVKYCRGALENAKRVIYQSRSWT